MKKIIGNFLFFIGVSYAYAYTGYGVCDYGKNVVDEVVCYGPTVMKGTTVKGDIKVTGPFQANNISAKNLVIEGPVEISNSQIAGSVKTAGEFSADHVEFKKGVAVTANNVVLNHSVVNGLMTITSNQKTPYLQVQCSSVITGAVLFDGKAGVVQITGESLVKGKVVNGAMEFVKRSC